MLIRRGDDSDFVKVLDFGIARLNWGEQSMATAAGLIFGTARYISPEGAQGEQVGPEGDVYATATLLYQMLAGRTPFEGEQAVALLIAQIHDAPDWPVTYSVPIPLRNSPVAPHVPNTQNVTVADRGVGAYFESDYKGLSFMSAFTEWQSTAFVMGTVGETRLTRDFANLGYDHKISANWDTSFNLTFTRTTFVEVPYPSAARESSEMHPLPEGVE